MRSRYISSIVIVIVLATSLFAGALPSYGQDNNTDDVTVSNDVETALEKSDEVNVIISLKDYSSDELKNSSAARSELKSDQNEVISDAEIDTHTVKKLSHIPVVAATVNEDQLDQLKQDDKVQSITQNKYFALSDYRSSISNTARPALNDVIDKVGAEDVWNGTTPYTGDSEKVVIIDTGVDYDHPFLDGSVTAGACFINGQNYGSGTGEKCPNNTTQQIGTAEAGSECTTNASSCSHGTHVAGIAGGRRNVSSAPIGGVAPDAEIVAIRVFALYSGTSACGSPTTCLVAMYIDILSALDWVVANSTGVASVNMSLASNATVTSACDSDDIDLTNTINDLKDLGVATVIAAGNSSSSSGISWPACISAAVSVGSVTKSDVVAKYSNSSPLVDILAPGGCGVGDAGCVTSGQVRSSVPGGTYAYKSGTSMAAPVIAGAFAVLKEAYPTETVGQLIARMQQSGSNITDARNGVVKPRLDLLAAITSDEPEIPTQPTSATLTAVAGYGRLTWPSVPNAISYNLYTSTGEYITTSTSTTITLPTTKKVSTRFGVTAANEVGESAIRYSNYITGLPGLADSGYAFFATNGAVIGKGIYSSYSRGAISGLRYPVVGGAMSAKGNGGWSVASNGAIYKVGSAKNYGSAASIHLNKPIINMATSATGNGYWLVAADGGIFTYGDAKFYGSTGSKKLNKPVITMAATPRGKGYWLVAGDGGIFTFGDARFYGSTGSKKLNKPIVGMTSTPSGKGYWLVASDGGIFTFGDARFYGSAGGTKLNKPIVSMAVTPTGKGYWLFASDGGVFSYGDAPYLGGGGGYGLSYPMAG